MAKSLRAEHGAAERVLAPNAATLEYLRTELRAQARGTVEQQRIAWAQSLVVHAVRASRAGGNSSLTRARRTLTSPSYQRESRRVLQKTK